MEGQESLQFQIDKLEDYGVRQSWTFQQAVTQYAR